MSDQDRVLDELEDLCARCFWLVDLLPIIDELDYDDPAAMAEFNIILAEMTKTQTEIEARLEELLKVQGKKVLLN